MHGLQVSWPIATRKAKKGMNGRRAKGIVVDTIFNHVASYRWRVKCRRTPPSLHIISFLTASKAEVWPDWLAALGIHLSRTAAQLASIVAYEAPTCASSHAKVQPLTPLQLVMLSWCDVRLIFGQATCLVRHAYGNLQCIQIG